MRGSTSLSLSQFFFSLGEARDEGDWIGNGRECMDKGWRERVKQSRWLEKPARTRGRGRRHGVTAEGQQGQRLLERLDESKIETWPRVWSRLPKRLDDDAITKVKQNPSSVFFFLTAWAWLSKQVKRIGSSNLFIKQDRTTFQNLNYLINRLGSGLEFFGSTSV